MAINKKTNPIGWFEIHVDDMARAKKFYEFVFKIKLEELSNPATVDQKIEMWVFPSDMGTYGASGTLKKMPGLSAAKNSVLIYFSCENCAIEAARAKEFGGKIEKSKFSIGEHGFIALVYDSEGNMIGLHSMK